MFLFFLVPNNLLFCLITIQNDFNRLMLFLALFLNGFSINFSRILMRFETFLLSPLLIKNILCFAFLFIYFFKQLSRFLFVNKNKSAFKCDVTNYFVSISCGNPM